MQLRIRQRRHGDTPRQCIDLPFDLLPRRRIRHDGVHEPIERRQPVRVLPSVAFMEAHRLKHRGQNIQRLGVAFEKQIAPQNLGAADVP